MKFHFGDFLDREGDYWNFIPNRDRFAYFPDNLEVDIETIRTVTITKKDDWRKVYFYENLEELTLHEPGKEQFEALKALSNLKRLRITHFRTKTIECLSSLDHLEELVLEYVSGFSDLSPLSTLKKLKSIHFENLRRVNNFSGLSGISSLKFLSIYGTLDWKQPIENFNFLNGLENLEVFSLWQVITKKEYPALLLLCRLNRLKRIKIPSNEFSTCEYVLVSTGLPKVKGTDWKPIEIYAYKTIPVEKNDKRMKLSDEEIKVNHPEIIRKYDGKREINDPDSEWFEFLDKGAGRIKCNSKDAKKKCEKFLNTHRNWRDKAKEILNN